MLCLFIDYYFLTFIYIQALGCRLLVQLASIHRIPTIVVNFERSDNFVNSVNFIFTLKVHAGVCYIVHCDAVIELEVSVKGIDTGVESNGGVIGVRAGLGIVQRVVRTEEQHALVCLIESTLEVGATELATREFNICRGAATIDMVDNVFVCFITRPLHDVGFARLDDCCRFEVQVERTVADTRLMAVVCRFGVQFHQGSAFEWCVVQLMTVASTFITYDMMCGRQLEEFSKHREAFERGVDAADEFCVRFNNRRTLRTNQPILKRK